MANMPTTATTTPCDSPAVVLVHGWGGSFARTWERSGFAALLGDAGREVIAVDLLGHGEAPKPRDPAAYTDLTGRIVEALPPEPVDAIGFSLGGVTLLRTAIEHRHRFRRLVLGGVGRNVFERDADLVERIVAAIECDTGHGDGDAEPDNAARLFAQYAHHPSNDALALAAMLRADPPPITDADLSRVTCPVLLAVGDADFVLPADRLLDALPNATLAVLRRTDHFATPESFEFIDAALEFLDAAPA